MSTEISCSPFHRLMCVLHILLTIMGHYICDENVHELCEISEQTPTGILDIAEGIMQYFADQRKAFLTVSLMLHENFYGLLIFLQITWQRIIMTVIFSNIISHSMPRIKPRKRWCRLYRNQCKRRQPTKCWKNLDNRSQIASPLVTSWSKTIASSMPFKWVSGISDPDCFR